MYQQIFDLHANTLKALAHPKRLEIVHLLQKQTLSVSQIQEMLDLPQANLSQHLQILKDAQILSSKKSGKQIFYQVTHKNFIKACDLIREVLILQHGAGPLADELTFKMSDLVPVVSDPICGMRLSPKTAAFAATINDHTSYFCTSKCHQKFLKKFQNLKAI